MTTQLVWNQHNTTVLVLDGDRWVEHVDGVRETVNPFSSSSRSAPRSCCQFFTPRRSPTTVHPLLPITSSHLRRHALILVRHIQSRPSFEEPAIDRYTYGVNHSPVPLFCKLMPQSSILQKTLQSHPTLTLTSPQSNARHDLKNGQAWRRS